MMRIGTKLALGTGTLLALGLVIGTVSYLQTSSLHRKLDELTSLREPVHTAANDLKMRLSEAESATLGYFLTGDTTFRAALERAREELQVNRETLLPLLSRATDDTTAATLIERLMGFHGLADEQIRLRGEQSEMMQQLLKNLDGIDGLLKDRVAASVRADDPIAYRRLQVALEMQIQMNAMVKALGSYLLTGEARFRARIDETRRSYTHFLRVYQVVLLSAREKAWADELIHRSDRSMAMAASVATFQVRRLTQMAAFLDKYRALRAHIDDRLLRSTTMDLAKAKKELIVAGERANSIIMAVLFMGMIFGIAAAVVTTRKITSPLRYLITVMDAVDHDEPSREIDLRNSDEFRQVGESFNTMLRRLTTANETLRDEIAERRKAEESLRMSELRFRTIFEDAPIGIALTDAQATILQANAPLTEILGGAVDGGLCGQTLSSVTGHEAIVHGSQAGAGRRFHLEMKGMRADRDPSWISVNISTVPSDNGEPSYFIVMMEDLTTQRELQKQLADAERERLERLRLFAHSVQRAQEEERARIARELHDDICQRLTGLTYHVEVLEEGIRPSSRRVAKQLRGIREELDRSVAEVRRISSNLRPSVLDDFGLVTALRILCKEFQNAHGIVTTFQADPAIPGRIDAESETAIYRIAQQALTNAARHAQATAVSLDLATEGQTLVLRISDDGRGFAGNEAGARNGQKGFGLVSMRERAELLGGLLGLSSDPERGTTVSVTIPVKEA